MYMYVKALENVDNYCEVSNFGFLSPGVGGRMDNRQIIWSRVHGA